MHRRFFFRAVSAVAGGAVTLTACKSTPEIIKIGVAVPLSGPWAAQGQDLLQGAQLAVQQINAQDNLFIQGKLIKLEIVAGDDQSNPEQGKQIAKAMLEARVVAVIGHLNANVSLSSAPIYASGQVTQMALSGQPEYTRLGLQTTLRLVANDTIQAKTLAAYAANQIKGNALALVDDGTPESKHLARTIEAELEKLEKKISLRRTIDPQNTAWNGLIAELKITEIDTYLTTQSDTQVLALCQQLNLSNLPNLQILGSDRIKTDALGALPLRGRQIFVTSPILDLDEFRQTSDFLQKFRTAYKALPSYAAHYSFDAVHVLVSAIRRAESTNRQKINDTLKNIDALAPVTNNIRFRQDGEQLYPIVSIYKWTRNRWHPVGRNMDF